MLFNGAKSYVKIQINTFPSVKVQHFAQLGRVVKDTSLNAKKTGGFFRALPDIHPAKIHYSRALKNLKKIKFDSSIKNARKAQQKLSAQSLDTMMKSLTVPITEYMHVYKNKLRELHPYESTIANLTVATRRKAGYPDLPDILVKLKTLRTSTSKLAKDYAGRSSKAESAAEAKELLDEGLQALEKFYSSAPEARALEELLEVQKDLRKIPVIELETPTVVLVGSPNVGKSSIVRAVSSGTPEVNDYPFTTRGVTVGHIVDSKRDLRFQVIDSPGLLDRPNKEFNEMEQLTFASMAHLPTAVMFVIDPSGLSGEKSTLQAQLGVRTMLKAQFPRRPWLDVVSKGDLNIPPEVLEQLPEGCITVSVKDGEELNLDVLKEEVEKMLMELMQILQQMATVRKAEE